MEVIATGDRKATKYNSKKFFNISNLFDSNLP